MVEVLKNKAKISRMFGLLDILAGRGKRVLSLGLVSLGLLVVSCSSPSHSSKPDVALLHIESIRKVTPSAELSLEAQVVQGINRFRAQQGLPPFARHGALEEAAEEHAHSMARKRQMSHDRFFERADEIKKEHHLGWTAENVMWGYGYAQEKLAGIIVQGWIDSPGHRKNLLAPNQFIGVGIAKREDGSVWATQLSARALPSNDR